MAGELFGPKDCYGFPVQKTAGNHRKFESKAGTVVVISLICYVYIGSS